jgi:hypothetical protein
VILVDSFDQAIWNKLQASALCAIREVRSEQEVETLFRILETPTFGAPKGWHICQSRPGTDQGVYFASVYVWEKIKDWERFDSPVKRIASRVDVSQIQPTVKTNHIELDEDFIEGLLQRIRHLKLPITPERSTIGLDGVTYEILFGNYFCNSSFSWWAEAPGEWIELETLVKEVIQHIEVRRING